ncbi:TfoX/Sxy family protein [Indioceanicola profundi]|uniref:TfoX/Sxy family protein n=1 Tax=Indioceanicola profundi TaxID=2220096 RepID=UPI000E6A9896|nr:TfoX/Sxy family protein [Indioceanicola profundi]
MSASRDYVNYLLELLAPLGEVKARAMFGGYGLSLDGLTFALVADDVLYFKVDEANRPAYTALGLKPFVPFPDKPDQTMGYHPPPETVFDDTDELLSWARPALEAAMRAKAKTKPRKVRAT